MIILQTKNLKKYYGSGDTQVRALDGVDLQVENGEFVAIVGKQDGGLGGKGSRDGHPLLLPARKLAGQTV